MHPPPSPPHRRAVLAGLVTLSPGLAMASARTPHDPVRWLDYEARLKARLADGGGGRFDRSIARDLLPATNDARAGVGAPPCLWDEDLAAAARAHAADLAARGYIEHISPEGFDPSHRLAVLARRRIGSASENIAYRRNTIASTSANLMQVWRESRPHWTNLLNPTHHRAGFGVVTVGQKTYAVGRYGHLDGELSAPLPFRLHDDIELADALSGAPPEIQGFNLSDPSDDRRVAEFAQGEAPALAPGVYQLGPRRRRDAGPWMDVLWGPIFVKL